MSRNYLRLRIWAAVLAPFLSNTAVLAASHVERGNLVFDNIPEAPQSLADAVDAYMGGREAVPLGWSPKGQLLIGTRFGDVDQLHIVDRPAGERRQLTFLHEPILPKRPSRPDPGRNAYVFLKDSGGNGNGQLYYQRMGIRLRLKLLTGRQVGVGERRWLPVVEYRPRGRLFQHYAGTA